MRVDRDTDSLAVIKICIVLDGEPSESGRDQEHFPSLINGEHEEHWSSVWVKGEYVDVFIGDKE